MTKILLIDSWNKVSGTSDNFVINFDNALKIKKYIQLIYAQIPNTCYNIRWNMFIIINRVSGSNTFNIISGWYDIFSLVEHIKTLFTNYGLSISYNKSTFKVSISSSSNILWIEFFNGLNKVLGFVEDYYQFTGTGVSYVSGDKWISLNSDNLLCIWMEE